MPKEYGIQPLEWFSWRYRLVRKERLEIRKRVGNASCQLIHERYRLVRKDRLERVEGMKDIG